MTHVSEIIRNSKKGKLFRKNEELKENMLANRNQSCPTVEINNAAPHGGISPTAAPTPLLCAEELP